jgi:hypothetical protein
MRNTRPITVLSRAIAIAVAGGYAYAGGPVGTIPFDGDGSGNGFTIDNAAFDFNDVTSAPCPDGATCTNGTATGGNLLMREVDANGSRFLQVIIADPDDGNGDFTYEATVSSGGDVNAIGAKAIIDDAANQYYSEQSAYRGALFGASSTNNNLAVEVYQSVGIENGFQSFHLETTQSPNEGASLLRNGRVQILQYKDDPDISQSFGHTIVTGSYQTNSGTLTIEDESFTYAAGNALSATWIRSTLIDEESGDIDFGLLIYRGNDGPTIGSGNAGGTPNGLVDPQFTQDDTDYMIQGFTQVIIDDQPFFEGADSLLNSNWDEDVFGPNPY